MFGISLSTSDADVALSIMIRAIASSVAPGSATGTDPGIYVEEREGREADYDNRIDQIRVMGNAGRASVGHGDGFSHMGLCLEGRGRTIQERHDRSICVDGISAVCAPNRRSSHYVSFVPPTLVN